MEVKKTEKADLQNKKSLFFLVGLCVALLGMIGLFSVSQNEVELMELPDNQEILEAEIIEITREEPPKIPTNAAPRLQVTSDILNIVRDDKKIENKLTFADIDENIDYTFDQSAGGGTYEGPMDDDPVIVVEDRPLFMGGSDDNFRKWVQERLKYPPIAEENNIEGRVTLKFVIERDGSLSNIEVLSTPDRSLSEEAIRVVKTSPKWTPAKNRGLPVRMYYMLPVDFKLQ